MLWIDNHVTQIFWYNYPPMHASISMITPFNRPLKLGMNNQIRWSCSAVITSPYPTINAALCYILSVKEATRGRVSWISPRDRKRICSMLRGCLFCICYIPHCLLSAATHNAVRPQRPLQAMRTRNSLSSVVRRLGSLHFFHCVITNN